MLKRGPQFEILRLVETTAVSFMFGQSLRRDQIYTLIYKFIAIGNTSVQNDSQIALLISIAFTFYLIDVVAYKEDKSLKYFPFM